MNEEFDDGLKNRITDVFDNYEDDSAHQGWLLLREKYPEKAKRPITWLWWASAAAILLVVLGVGIWLNKGTPVKNTNHIVQTVIKNPVQDSTKPNTANGSTKTPTDLNADKHVQQNQISGMAYQNNSKITAPVSAPQYTAKNGVNNHRDKLNNTQPDVSKYQTPQTAKPGVVYPKPPEQQLAANTGVNNLVKPENKGADSVKLADNSTKVPVKTALAEVIKPVIKEPKHPVFTAQNPTELKTPKQVDKKVKFGVYAATYFNYAKGSDNEFNVGAGFSSEIKLVGNLKLLTGIAINQNSLNYKTAIPQAANHYLTASLAKESDGISQAAATPSLGTTFAASAVKSTSPVLKNYQASLIGLDIPVNLKYQFANNDTYIAAGFSSGTYVNETYQFAYNYLSPSSYATPDAQQQNTKTQTVFNTFDFARTLNLAFGMGYPLGKKNRLIIEPFVKYPLNGLGSQDIKFGAGGINLKFNFATGKK